MTSRPQFSLGIAGSDYPRAATHSAQSGGCFHAQFPSLRHDEVGDLVRLEMAPHILDRVELGRIRGQPLDHKTASGSSHVVFDQQAAMDRRSIPEGQDFAGNVTLKVLEELDYLRTLDAARMNLEIEPPERKSTDDRKALPIERLVQDGRLSTRGPSACPGGTSAQAAFVEEDEGAPLLPGLFLRRARRLVSSSGWPSRRAQPPGAPVAGN